MSTHNLIKKTLLIFTSILATSLAAQSVSGKIIDNNGAAIPFVTIIEKGTTNGTTTNDQGYFKIVLKKEKSILQISSIGFTSQEQKVNSGTAVSITLQEGALLDEVVLTGNRSKPRTIIDSAVPIDNIEISELQETGKTSVDQMLTFAVPSYNASNQTVSDATAHFDPADLRGLGPSRTLVLINGKRKNQSALIYVSDTPGKGEVGTDIKSIPTAAIKNIEVLRDGASAQYGSDAVAGVINIILKKDVAITQVNANTGISKEGDGFEFGADANHTVTFNNGAFINASISGSHQEHTNRAGTPGNDKLFGGIYTDYYNKELSDGNITTEEHAAGIAFANSLSNGTHPWIQKNPSLGMTIGQPESTKISTFINAEFPLNNNTNLYAFGGYTFKKGTSFALYRTPYWKEDPHHLLHKEGTTYQGFQPTFETGIKDISFTMGSTFKLAGFNADLSATYGSNTVDYTIGNTLNPTLKELSPTTFNGGSYGFDNLIGNFDLNRSFGDISIGLGIEARQESFTVGAGQKESYIGDGAQSFPGLKPINALKEKRTNVGTYATTDWDISDNLLIGGAIRYENFPDFGGNLSWKLNSRYKLNKTATLRTSYSTGFRAPSLHQIYFSSIIALPGADGKGIINQGNFKNTDKVIDDLGIQKLFAETSRNFSAGFIISPTSKFTISLDYYNVKVNDRILLAGQVSEKNDNGQINPEIKTILDENKIGALTFFFNTLNTTTQGFDYSIRYKKLKIGQGIFGFNSSLNVNHTSLNGTIKVPKKLKDYKKTVFNREEQSRITSARPNLKFIYGANYKINDFKISLNNTYFGGVKWQHAKDAKKDQTFKGKTLTDVSLGYNISENIALNIHVNNVFNVYPNSINPKGDTGTNLGGRFKHPWEVNQFGFNGTTFKAGINFKF